MTKISLFNTISRKIEVFQPLDPKQVTMYTCGPTVYGYVHIGNFRTYISADLLVRTLQYNGYPVKYIMNITDVGHLTGDNLGDADTGEDRLEKASQKEGKTAWDIAQFYTEKFLADYTRLNLVKPEKFTKATDYIPEQIDLVKTLGEKGFTYTIDDGIYFDTSKFPDYGKLSFLDLKNLRSSNRIEPNPQKKNPWDFALWKFSPVGEKRQMEWESPWGVGFPGWHIECSAMSMKNLGETIDIHVGGEDLAATHHPNEIAQSEAATGKEFVHYWIHGAHLQVDGGRMGRSLGNTYTISDLEEKGFDPLALRYLYLTGRYRDKLNFTWESLQAAQNALDNLYSEISSWDEPKIGCAEYEEKFLTAINDDLNTPQALSLLWDLVKTPAYPTSAKLASITKFDQVLGLDLPKLRVPLSEREQKLLDEREVARANKDFARSDNLRQELAELGIEIMDSQSGLRWKRTKPI